MDHQEMAGLLVIDNMDLGGQFASLPGLLFQYGMLEADAIQLFLESKAMMEQVHAAAHTSIRGATIGKAPTVDQLDAMIELDNDYMQARGICIAREGDSRRMKAMVTALLAKRDMLVQLGSSQRAQLQAGMDTGIRATR